MSDKSKEFLHHNQERNDAKSKVDELEANKSEIEQKLQNQELETPEGKKQFEELRAEQDSNESNLYGARDDLSAKEANLEGFKRANQSESAEATQIDQTSVPDPSKSHDGTQPELNDQLKPSEDYKDWNNHQQDTKDHKNPSSLEQQKQERVHSNDPRLGGSNEIESKDDPDKTNQEAQQEQVHSNDSRLSSLSQQYLADTQEQGKELQNQGVEQEKER